MKKIKLQIFRQINHHECNEDGYCSGQENEYSEETLIYYVNVPNKYKDWTIGTNLTDYYSKMDLAFVAPEIIDDVIPNLDLKGGSGYCDVGDEGKKYDLGTHDYRITVINAIIVEKD